MSTLGQFALAAAQVGITSILIKPVRGIFNATTVSGDKIDDIIAQATIEERHIDQMEITEQPVEQGAFISDHAFKLPASVVLKLGWSNSPASTNPLSAVFSTTSALSSAGQAVSGIIGGAALAQSILSGSDTNQCRKIYQDLLALQASRALFNLYTGKRVYINMLVKTLTTESDFESENALPITMECRQFIIVNSQNVSLPKASQKTPKKTASQVNKGKVFPPITEITIVR